VLGSLHRDRWRFVADDNGRLPVHSKGSGAGRLFDGERFGGIGHRRAQGIDARHQHGTRRKLVGFGTLPPPGRIDHPAQGRDRIPHDVAATGCQRMRVLRERLKPLFQPASEIADVREAHGP
jgi:hypothetical protein